MRNSMFGEKLKKLRTDKGWSQEKLAEELNVSRQAVYKWESDKGYPDIENLLQISEIFDVTLDELLKDELELNEEKDDDMDGSFEQFSDPGFYLGFALIIAGAITNFGAFSEFILFFGVAVLIFYKEILNLFKVVVKDVRGIFKQS